MKAFIVWLVVITLVFVSSCASYTQQKQEVSNRNSSPSEGSTESIAQQQTEEVMPQNLVSAEIEPRPNQANQAALALQRRGFRILHIGSTISVQAPRSLWESTFNVSFEEQKKTILRETGTEVTYWRAITDHLTIPEELNSLIAEVMFVEPPEFYQGQP